MMDLNKHPFRFDDSQSQGRKRPIEPDPYRNHFARDRDRILHSKSFRRLKHKTQVFLKPDGDHYRTRLTHTLEVNQIARTIGRALGLNEDLIEAISYGHDLGHTPFGHAGERVLNRIIPGGFRHVKQSVRVVEVVEHDYQGLNLCAEVIDGIAKHSKGKGSICGSEAFRKNTTLEAQVVRISDLVAYLHHDCDDALRAGVITERDLPETIQKQLGQSSKARLSSIVHGIIEENLNHKAHEVVLSNHLIQLINDFRSYMFEAVYENPVVTKEFEKPQILLEKISKHYLAHKDKFIEDSHIQSKIQHFSDLSHEDQIPYIVDFISGMTDVYALMLGQKYNWV